MLESITLSRSSVRSISGCWIMISGRVNRGLGVMDVLDPVGVSLAVVELLVLEGCCSKRCVPSTANFGVAVVVVGGEAVVEEDRGVSSGFIGFRSLKKYSVSIVATWPLSSADP